MPSWRNFCLDFVQAAAFTPEHSAFSSAKAVGIILANFQDRFDGEMQVLPLPTDVPPEIHRVVLASSDAQWKLSMGPARIDSACRIPKTSPSPSLDAIALKCSEVLERYVGESGARVGRVALIVHRYCPHDTPAQSLIETFCNEASQKGPLSRSESFEIHNHKVYAPQSRGLSYPINSWVRCKTGKLVADGHPAILVHQDLNTLASTLDSSRFDANQIRSFFDVAAREADEILGKYFPE